jgi:hypothetical protein
MKKRFPLRGKGRPQKWAACEAMTLNMKPTLGSIHNKIVRFPNPIGSVAESFPVILNFPVRAL